MISVLAFTGAVLAIMLHEISHGLAALWCGDRTAWEQGRISLNPVRHVDPVGTLLVPFLLSISHAGVVFGWAKPVPIALWRCRNPRQAFWITALAGPLSNLVQAVAAALLLKLLLAAAPRTPLVAAVLSVGRGELLSGAGAGVFLAGWVYLWLYFYIGANIVLMAFNLIPIPPLDGSRLLTAVLPPDLQRVSFQLERYGFFLVFALLWFVDLGPFFHTVLTGFLRVFGLD